MRIGGLQKSSLIDYPGKIATIIFTQGCHFRCHYCHNPELVEPHLFYDPIPEEEIFGFLAKRIGKLDAVTITGGEPTIYPDLPSFMKRIKEMGFLIKLDTNGSNPERLEEIIRNKLVDYLAMDIKTPLLKYQEVINGAFNAEKIKKSIALLMNSDISYEFRTTIVKSLLSPNDILEIGELIKGTPLYALQKFRPTKALNPLFLAEETYSDDEFEEMRRKLLKFVKRCIVR